MFRRSHRRGFFAAQPLRGDVQKFSKQLHHIGAGDGLAANILTDLAFPKFMTLFLRRMDQIGLLHAGGIHSDLQLFGKHVLIHAVPSVQSSNYRFKVQFNAKLNYKLNSRLNSSFYEQIN